MSLTQVIRSSPALRSVLAVPLAVRRSWLDHVDKPARTFTERLEAMLVGEVQLKVEEFEGEFFLGPRSHLLHRLLVHGTYEPELAALFAGHIDPARDVVDVGANIGFFTTLAARKLTTGRVLAAEPTAAAHDRLLRNLAHNGVAAKAIVFHGLVAATEGELTLNVVSGREEYSSLGAIVHPSVAGEATTVETVAARPLDALVRDHGLSPALVKIDVEGAELDVLQGAEETLKNHRPVVISEFSAPLLKARGASPDAILALFDRCGYDVKDPFNPLMDPADIDFGDIIATPRPNH